jgi:plasmid stability protein
MLDIRLMPRGATITALRIRNLDEETPKRLKIAVREEGVSVNSLVVRLIETATGVRPAPGAAPEHHDLHALAGTWSETDAQAFMTATAPFERIDDGLRY